MLENVPAMKAPKMGCTPVLNVSPCRIWKKQRLTNDSCEEGTAQSDQKDECYNRLAGTVLETAGPRQYHHQSRSDSKDEKQSEAKASEEDPKSCETRAGIDERYT